MEFDPAILDVFDLTGPITSKSFRSGSWNWNIVVLHQPNQAVNKGFREPNRFNNFGIALVIANEAAELQSDDVSAADL